MPRAGGNRGEVVVRELRGRLLVLRRRFAGIVPGHRVVISLSLSRIVLDFYRSVISLSLSRIVLDFYRSVISLSLTGNDLGYIGAGLGLRFYFWA